MKYYILIIEASSVSLSYATAGEEVLFSMVTEEGGNLSDLKEGDRLLVYKDYPISACTMSLKAKGNNRFVKEVEVANGANINSFPEEVKRKIYARNGLFVDITEQEFCSVFLAMISSLSSEEKPHKLALENKHSLQQIFYGAPGTGKSYYINKETQQAKVFRTTFHPDTDYSTFVGSYKPTTLKQVIRDERGSVSEQSYCRSQIVYDFVAQSFLQAYVEAWRRFNETDEAHRRVFLVIEEINRGNCAQIFGDLFQLLDRNSFGFSDYPIHADADMQQYLHKQFAQLEWGGSADFNRMYPGQDMAAQVKSGEVLLLPDNLHIWATMNTSDQSLFPIDSAFKRRWDWKYIKIKEGKDETGNSLNWSIRIQNKNCQPVQILNEESLSWWTFLRKINEIIASMTLSADKQLGYFFCKAREGVIDGDTLVGKVFFYLWNDVFKDYGFEDDSLFRYKVLLDGKEWTKELTFPDFYEEDGEAIDAQRVVDFVEKVMNWQSRDSEN